VGVVRLVRLALATLVQQRLPPLAPMVSLPMAPRLFFFIFKLGRRTALRCQSAAAVAAAAAAVDGIRNRRRSRLLLRRIRRRRHSGAGGVT
jgi:hypothetical protein